MRHHHISLLGALAFMGCMAEVSEPSEHEADVDVEQASEVEQALSPALPQGMTCGLSYWANSTWAVTSCNGWSTLTGVAPGFARKADGDWGAPAGQGFWHQTNATFTAGLQPDQVLVPRGTTCGFGHSRNSPNEMCMGRTVRVDGCPNGWQFRVATDVNSDGGAWYWCEYQDPNQLCPPFACTGNVPSGTVCGVSDTSTNFWSDGQCENHFIRKASCPTGYLQRLGGFDLGRGYGEGLLWCVKR